MRINIRRQTLQTNHFKRTEGHMKFSMAKSRSYFFLGILFLTSSGFKLATLPPSDGETRIFIDGKQIVPEGTITLEKDETILLEATGLKPKSEVYIKVKKVGIKWAEDTYTVNDSGTVKQFLDVPERDLTVNCFLTYFDAAGRFHEAEFKLRVE